MRIRGNPKEENNETKGTANGQANYRELGTIPRRRKIFPACGGVSFLWMATRFCGQEAVMSERSLIEKGYSRYLADGDYAIDTATGFPLIVRDNQRRHYIRTCEVFGFFHEFGSVYSKNLRPITKEEFETAKAQMNSQG